MAPEATGLSDRQFKRKVFEELQNAGTIDGLKGTLRSRLVGVLQRRDPSVFAGSGPGPGQQSLWQRAANSLYVEYLASQNYSYSLSVFQPECGLTNQQVMTRDELSRVLSLGGSIASYLPKSPVDGSEPPLLLKLLQGVADMGGVNTRREMQTQTDDFDNNTSLALRMQQIDEMHERAVETERLAPLRDAEERMSAFQKECEARLRAEMDEQVRRVRDHEVGQARLEEAAKHRRQLADAREELERVHAERLRKLRAREESQMERVRSAEAALERAAYDHRQRLAAEHETLRAAKDAWEKEQATREMKRARDAETFARRESEMTTKEQAWSLRHAEMSAEAEERVATRRREADVDAERRLETVTSEMAAIAEERARLEAERAQHAAEMAALSQARRDAAAARQHAGEHATAADILNIQLDDLRAQLDAARDALEKRGIPLPVSREAGGVGIGLAMNAAGASNSGPAYAQVVAAMERAKAEAAVARQEIAQRRKDLSRIKQERNSAMQERNDAVREAAEWKGKCELANKMADEAVKRAEETWAMMQETKSTMKSMLDEERDKRVQAEAAASAFKTAAEIPGIKAAQLGLQTSLADDVGGSATRQRALDATTAGRSGAGFGGSTARSSLGSGAGSDDSPTVNVLRLQKLEHQHEMQRSALDAQKRKLEHERNAREASAAMAAAEIEAIRRADAARLQASKDTHKFYLAESMGASNASKSYADDSFEVQSDEEDESAPAESKKPASPSPKKTPVSPKAAASDEAASAAAAEAERSAEEERRMRVAAEEKRQSEAAAALEAERKKREELSAKMSAAARAPAPVAEPTPVAAPKSPARGAASPRKSKGSTHSAASAEIEELIDEDEDDFVPEELDEDVDVDLSLPDNSDKSGQSMSAKSGSGDSVF